MNANAIDWMAIRPVRDGERVSSGEETAVYNPSTGGLHVLNASALAIWELCDGETTGSEMADAIFELTELSQEEAQSDVFSTLERLFELSLVTIPSV